ncbi:MAG: hypothetical protein MOB07_16245 [Acidobacteria bacterium]|nr:hypothetical protein [Acidobacteriota bacterium]
MLDTLRFVVIEDKIDDRREVLNRLSDAGLTPENKLGEATTYEEAKTLLEEQAQNLNVVFLDLNLPRDSRDGRPERGHGKRLLDLIHDDLNRRPWVDIRAIVVSGENIHDGMTDEMMRERYAGTLIGIAAKSELPITLKANLKRLKKDPLLASLRRLGIDALSDYQILFDNTKTITDRLESAKRLACRLVRYEGDYRLGKIGACDGYGEDLNRAIKEIIEDRFEVKNGKRYVQIRSIKTDDSWDRFLWRGAMLQHLYTINGFRRAFVHLQEHPYASGENVTDEWTIPPDVQRRVEQGDNVAKMIELAVEELLEWYMPWHEQVYLPWAKKQESAKENESP